MSTNKSGALYAILKQNLMSDIKAGVYKPGERLPTEDELCRMHGVSRTTVRLALQQLELEGRIVRIQGKGTFVTTNNPRIVHHMQAPIISFTQHMKELGRQSETRVLHASVIPAAAPVHEILQVPSQSPVTKLTRLRLADDEPIACETSYIPWHLAPGLSNENCSGSLFQLLREKFALHIDRSVDTLKPVATTEEIASLLKIPAGSPSVDIRTVSYLADNTPAEYSEGIFRSDVASFIIERRHDSE